MFFAIARRPKFEGTQPVAKLDEGPDGVLIELSTEVSREDVYNAVVASYQSSDPDLPRISAVAYDDNPASSTYYGGPFGKRVLILDADETLTTRALCRAKAKAVLEQRRFPERELNLSAVPNPALEPDDIIQITMLDGTIENHMIGRSHVSYWRWRMDC